MPMPDPHPIGTRVQQSTKPIQGEVADVRFSAESMKFEYLVNYLDANGDQASRWFTHDQIEEMSQ